MRRPRLVLALVTPLCLVCPSVRGASAPRLVAPAQVDVAAVISGGVSLGAYQAGGTWADLETMRVQGGARRLAVVTGASAGNINAFLAAIYWCDVDSPAGRLDRTVFANPFFDVWMNMGWEKLSPKNMTGRAYAGLFAHPVGSTQFRSVSAGIAAHGGGAAWFEADTPFTDDDGLFTRSAFAAAEAYLAQRLVQARSARGTCEIAVGVTVTREAAADYPLETVSAALDSSPQTPPAEDRGLRVPTQRYVVPLRFVVDTEGGHVRNAVGAGGRVWWADPSHRRIAKALHLPTPEAAGGDIPPLEVLRVVQASSAFPVVFAPVRLRVCLAGGDLGGATALTDAGRCPEGTQAATERFADGGFFDNVPLGLAMELIADRPPETRAETVEYVYVDPENRRVPLSLAPRAERRHGFDLAWATLADVISEARTFELQGLARYARAEVECGPTEPCPDGPRQFRASSRHHRIVGAYLVHNFAAFTHRIFRIHDYLVGIYDSVFLDAGGGDLRDDAAAVARLTEAFAVRLHTLGLDADRQVLAPDGLDHADELLWRLFREEVADRTRAETRAAACALLAVAGTPRREVCSPISGRSAWRLDEFCLSRPGGQVPCRHPILAVHETLRGVAPPGHEVGDFDGFVAALGRTLANQGLTLPPTPGETPSSELVFDTAGAPGDFRDWTRAQHMRFVERALAVESHDAAIWARASRSPAPEDVAVIGVATADLGRLSARAVPLLDPKPRERLDLDPSTVDAYVRDDATLGQSLGGALLHLFPWSLGWDARRLGPALGWEPRFDLFDAPLAPRLQYTLATARNQTAPTLFHRLGAGLGYDALLGGTAFLTAGRPQAAGTRPWGAGLAISFDVLRSLRFTVGMDRALTLSDGDWVGRDAYFMWSLLDLNGGLAWLALSP